MGSHDPLKFATGLSAKLASRSRHVCAFLGAGTSKACGLPDVKDLQTQILADLKEPQKSALAKQLARGNLEQALSRLRRIHALLADPDTIDGLTGQQAKDLDGAVCGLIVKKLVLDKIDTTAMTHFAAWLGRANYHSPVEVFTVNYDLLIETGLEALKIPYFDGFVGTLQAHFQTEMVEASATDREWLPSFFVRLWKLHGSVNWAWETQRIVRLGQPVPSGAPAAIYPSDAKYDESRRVPFVVLQDRFRRALHVPETLLLISGYAFGDAHLNEIIFDAATRRERSEVIVFCRSKIPEVLAEKASILPNIQAVTGKEAILGGVKGEWKAPEDLVPGVWEDGQLALREFKPLATYMARSVVPESNADILLKGLLAAGATPAASAAAPSTGS